MDNATPFKWRHFEATIMLLCICWYLRYPLSYREPYGDDAGTGIAVGPYHDLSLSSSGLRLSWRNAAVPISK